jgi:glutathione peroxidase
MNVMAQNVYDFTVKDRRGNDVSLSDYKGKVLLIVNTATRCGFTPQYEELESLYKEYKDQGLEILDFSCNQFGEQAPGT